MLRSELFRGNARLQGCAVSHSQHVVQGDRGDFVSKIQEALVMLDGAVITGDEVPTQTYGPSTADAVLEYKSARDIINRSYQTTADNIVGIMTINRLDTEVAALEALMPEMIRRTRLAAFQRTFAAFMRVVGIGPPPPPNRPDPNAENRRQARLVAIDIFNNPNPDMDDIGSGLGDMRNRLVNPALDRGHFPDPRVGNRSAFVVGNRVPIFLCPRFFNGGDEGRIRTFVHESAHLIGIGDPNGEAYYLRFNRANEDPSIIVGTPTSTNRADHADTWAKYVNAVTNQPADA